MLPLTNLRPARLNTAKGPAIFLSKDARASAFLLSGTDDPMCMLLDGPYCGRGGRSAQWNVRGVLVEGVEFVVDPSSAFVPSHIDRPVGAIILTTVGPRITIVVKDGHGFEEARDFALGEEHGTEETALEMGYSRWKAVLHQAGESVTVFEFDAALPSKAE